ncbi:MAG: GSU2403 family nucleotidyltransferase fold protein [Atribacterota bacterium]|jgi:hypothetical protein|nr:GSU2403 family nucleotidyltransferase fold protein [Atribacterota bacterium]
MNVENTNFFIKTLKAFHNAGVLQELILVGSWCHHLYRIYFNNTPEIPIIRTLDIDFLIPNPARIKQEISIPEILTSLDFIPLHNYITGLTKYIHPELELEFLTPDLGKGKGSTPYNIPLLHINAQGLRYLNLIQDHILEIEYLNMIIKVPEPAAYVLHKFIVFELRKQKTKQDRDLYSAKAITEFLIGNDVQNQKLVNIFYSIPLKWQKKILKNTKIHYKSLYDFLIQNIGI